MDANLKAHNLMTFLGTIIQQKMYSGLLSGAIMYQRRSTSVVKGFQELYSTIKTPHSNLSIYIGEQGQ
jgi:hypothetical protein